ncbi:MAG: hypothetical protein J7L96_00475 [Bacteroidales bacterium]|nr:hypothetical protein [Bacteroidales bacterium]
MQEIYFFCSSDLLTNFVVMQAGLDTVIYIVLGLFFVLAQVAKKKKAAEKIVSTDSEDHNVEANRSPTSLFEELLGFKEQNIQEPVDVIASPIENISPLASSESYDYKEDGGILMNRETEMTPVDESETVLVEVKPSQEEDQGFDLRKAVIYSVILEPKYF